jgi:hypothetical protein
MTGERLRSKLDRATKEYGDQIESFTAFSMQQAARVPAWKKKVEDFERDGTKENPYRMVRRGKFLELNSVARQKN